MFASALEHFATVCMKKVAKRVFWGRIYCFGVPSFRKICSHEHTQLSQIDLKRCFGSVFEHFATVCMKKVAKRLFRGRIHCFDVPNFRKICAHEHTQLSPMDLKRCLGVFWSISLPFAWKKLQNGCIGAECTGSGYRTSVKYVRTYTPNCLQ